MIRTLIKIFLMPSCCLCTIVYVGDAEPNNCTMTKRIVIIGFPVHWLHLQSLVTGGHIIARLWRKLNGILGGSGSFLCQNQKLDCFGCGDLITRLAWLFHLANFGTS